MAPPHVLFLCTGNYYRSRYAEYLFEHLARAQGSSWRARSRGLALSPENPGPLSVHVPEGLLRAGVEPPTSPRAPVSVTATDLADAAHVVAIDRVEHEPMLEAAFPVALEGVEFWEVPDVDRVPPTEALPHLRGLVEGLLGRLDPSLSRAGDPS
jgi:protein-tyrosine phosphatase